MGSPGAHFGSKLGSTKGLIHAPLCAHIILVISKTHSQVLLIESCHCSYFLDNRSLESG